MSRKCANEEYSVDDLKPDAIKVKKQKRVNDWDDEDGHFSVHVYNSSLDLSSESDKHLETSIYGNFSEFHNLKPNDFIVMPLKYDEGTKKKTRNCGSNCKWHWGHIYHEIHQEII